MIMNILLGAIAVAIVIASIRLFAGPTAADRLLSLDTLTTITLALVVMIGLLSGRAVFMDVALVYAVLGFIGVVIVAKFLEGDV